MATKLVDIWATENAEISVDSTSPVQLFKNTSTGAGVKGQNTSTGAGVVGANTGTGPGVTAEAPASSGATVAALRVTASVASQAAIEFQGPLISTASINVAANQSAFVIPVYHQTNKTWGYFVASKGVV